MAEILDRLGTDGQIGKILFELLGEIATSAVLKSSTKDKEATAVTLPHDDTHQGCKSVPVSPNEHSTIKQLSKSDDEGDTCRMQAGGNNGVDPSLGRPRYQWQEPEKCNSYEKDQRKSTAELKQLFSVYVGHLPTDITEDELVDLFKDIGEVISAFVFPTQHSKGYTYGFVRFLTLEEAKDAVREKNLKVLGKMQIHVELSADTRQKIKDNDEEEGNSQLLRKDYPKVIHRPSVENDDKMIIGKIKTSLCKLKANRSSFADEKDQRKSTAELKQLFSVYVGHLPTDITEDELVDLFKDIGEVISAFVFPTQHSKGYTYGFVRFLTLEEAKDAVREKNLKVLGKMQIHVELSADTRQKIKDNDEEEGNSQLLRKDYPKVIHRPSVENDDKMIIGKIKTSLCKLKANRSSFAGNSSSEEIFENLSTILKMLINYPMNLADASADEGNGPSDNKKTSPTNFQVPAASSTIEQRSLLSSSASTAGHLLYPAVDERNILEDNTNEHFDTTSSSTSYSETQYSLRAIQSVEECSELFNSSLVEKVREFLDIGSSEQCTIPEKFLQTRRSPAKKLLSIPEVEERTAELRNEPEEGLGGESGQNVYGALAACNYQSETHNAMENRNQTKTTSLNSGDCVFGISRETSSSPSTEDREQIRSPSTGSLHSGTLPKKCNHSDPIVNSTKAGFVSAAEKPINSQIPIAVPFSGLTESPVPLGDGGSVSDFEIIDVTNNDVQIQTTGNPSCTRQERFRVGKLADLNCRESICPASRNDFLANNFDSTTDTKCYPASVPLAVSLPPNHVQDRENLPKNFDDVKISGRKSNGLKPPTRRELVLAPSFSKPLVKGSEGSRNSSSATKESSETKYCRASRNDLSRVQNLSINTPPLASPEATVMTGDSAILNISEEQCDVVLGKDLGSRLDCIGNRGIEESEPETIKLKEHLREQRQKVKELENSFREHRDLKREKLCNSFEDDTCLEIEAQIHDAEVLLQKKTEIWSTRSSEQELAYERELLRSGENTEYLSQLAREMRKEHLRNEISVTELKCKILEMKTNLVC